MTNQPEPHLINAGNRLRKRALAFTPPPTRCRLCQIAEATDLPLSAYLKPRQKYCTYCSREDLSRLRSDTVADELGVSPTTLRRRLRADRMHYQELLDLGAPVSL